MTKPGTFQNQLDVLAYGEVHPLLFATDIERQERLGVHVVLISPPDDVEAGGHTSTLPIFSRYFSLPEDVPVTDEQVRQMRKEAIVDFSLRLREVLRGEP